ncbi:alpha-N-arabinofuranosidase [Salinibacterium sp. dk2585]|uniref:arabinosylfuranosidase ArfA n=1 Tax=unclassified Salinibacterium TaxID=2632331 RepID=UPI0011C249AB|nr:MULTISPECIES: alpha-N-arabinofuranosidase [unclassified Salinibacterium]QEE60701.1 alpha-N-arabinofuranosidase [Salinibacterium sp. dk2585]TXK55773.1 alpha-N-arabinofuranosidase [Salinibacterium sp. dk5596]
MAKATLVIDRSAIVTRINRRIFGSFVEHLGRCVYDGIYEPNHATANEDGFRTDVIELVKELGTTTIRYPGGNFVSGYRWEDGIGPRDQRPVRRDLAWHSLETNQVGVDEFARWAKLTGSEIMMAVNLGTRGVLEALDLLEYANHPSGTRLSDLRIANGAAEPYDIRMWCLGNEMDGPWQVGAMSADDYGKLAARTAAAMKMTQKDLELVVCGSSSSSMPTFGEWERVVLEHAYGHVDYVSCHAYYQERGGDLGSYLASSLDMEYFISTVVATADHVKHKKRSDKTMQLSFDEWNIWYLDEHKESDEVSETEWPIAPRQLEDVYSVADAVVLGNLLITLLKHHDRVTSASLAQLVNVIAPIMTEPGGDVWRQTTFFPFSVTSRMARGSVIRPVIASDRYETALYGEADVVDSVATVDDDGAASVFLVNRSTSEPATITIDVRDLGVNRVTEAQVLHDDDVYAKNTLAQQDRVGLRALEEVFLDGDTLTVTLPPVSWAAIGVA